MRASRALLAALAAAQVAYGRVPGERGPGSTRALVGLMLAASATEAAQARGARRGWVPVAAAGGLGFAAELAGVATGKPFGRYHYSGKLGPRVGGVPLLAGAAWAMMARPAWVVAGQLAARRGPRVAAAAGALAAWDVFLDPRMAREGYWTLAGRRPLRGRAGVELPRLVGDRPRRLRGLVGARRRGAGPRRRRRARPLRLDVGGRDVRQRRAVAPAAGGRRGRARDGRVRRARAAAAMARVVVIGAGAGGLAAARPARRAGARGRRPRGGARPRAARPGGSTRDGVRLGLRSVAADDAVGARGAVRRDRRAAARGARAAARRAGHPLPVRRRHRLRPLGRSGALARRARRLAAGRGRRVGALPRHLRGDVARVGGRPRRARAVAAADPAAGCAAPVAARPRARAAVAHAAAARPRAHRRPAAAHGDRAVRDVRGRRPAARAGGARGGRVRGARVGRVASARRDLRRGRGARAAAGGARRRAARTGAAARPDRARRARRRARRAGRSAWSGVETDAGLLPADAVVAAVDAEAVHRDLLGRPLRPRERSVSGPGADARACAGGRRASPTTR